jgi:hypothetical protein
MVEMKMRNGINHIDKLDFLEAYPLARIDASKSESIKNSFGAAGLVPFSPERVISKLDIQLRTPTPPLARVVIGIQKRPRTMCNCKNKLRQSKHCFVQDQEAPQARSIPP